MSCDLADDRVWNAERHQDRGSCVPQVVNADVLDAGCLRERAELFAEVPAIVSLRFWATRGRSRWKQILVRAVRRQRLECLNDRLRDRHLSLMSSLRADQSRVRRAPGGRSPT